jgi:hypothetical protein
VPLMATFIASMSGPNTRPTLERTAGREDMPRYGAVSRLDRREFVCNSAEKLLPSHVFRGVCICKYLMQRQVVTSRMTCQKMWVVDR